MKKLLTVILMFSFIEPLFAQSITISPTNNGLQQRIKVFGDVATFHYPEFVGIRGRGTSAIPSNTLAGDILLRISGNGFRTVGINPTSLTSASIDFFASSDFTNTTGGGEIKFFTGNLNSTNGASGSYKMILTNNGNLGVGTITPSSKLHIFSGTSGVTPLSNAKVFIEDNTHAYLSFGTPDNSESGILFGKASFGGASGGIIYTANRDMQLRTSTNDTRMTITEAGNVGIGINPTAKFTVNGDVAYSSKTNSTTTGTINNFDRAGNSVIRFDGIGSIILNGITGGTDGLIVHIYTTFRVTQLSLSNQNGGSLSENQIITGGSILLFNDGAITLIYDGTSQKWRVLHYQQ